MIVWYILSFIFLVNDFLLLCNYWVPLAIRYAFIMASTSPMYFYYTFCIFTMYIVRWKQINWIELKLNKPTHYYSPHTPSDQNPTPHRGTYSTPSHKPIPQTITHSNAPRFTLSQVHNSMLLFPIFFAKIINTLLKTKTQTKQNKTKNKKQNKKKKTMEKKIM